jgi:hypothetical protein
MSNLSELLPAGAGAKSADFVASGTLGSGVTVALKSDGTVEAISETVVSSFTGAKATFATEIDSNYQGCGFDPISGKFLIAYRDLLNSNYITGVVATISGTSVSFGTPVVVESVGSSYPNIVYDESAAKLVVAYNSGGSNFRAVVATISGTSVTYGTAASIGIGSANISGAYSSAASKIVFAYTDSSATSDGKTVVATVSGTSISLGTPTTYETGTTSYTSICYDPNEDKFIIAYKKTSLSSGYGVAVVGTLSGTSVSFGTQQTFNAAVTNFVTCCYDLLAQKVLFVYDDVGNSGYATMLVATVSGTSLTFGAEATLIAQGTSEYMSSVYDSNANVCLVVLNWSTGGAVYNVSISGTTPTSTSVLGTSVRSQGSGIAFDSSTSNSLIAFRNSSASDIGQALPFRVGYAVTNNTDFIGITDQAIADTATGAVIVQGGVSANVTGLTANTDYYVQADGTVSATVSTVPAGRALSTTSILLEG